jgi:hypothetical protein
MGGLCGNQELRRRTSPDSKLDVVVFQRDCGATTGYSTQVTIVPSGAKLPNEIGNVLVLDNNPGIDVQWTSAERLTVAIPDTAKSSRKTDQVSVSNGLASKATVTVDYVRAAP